MMFVWTALAHLRAWEWIGILVARLAVGALFFLSGRGKLFVPRRREQMRQTLVEAHVPFPDFNVFFVSTVEFVFGLCLLLGLVTPLACAMLCGVMIVALATSVVPTITASGLLDWLSEFLYLPEVLYLVILIWLFFAGPEWLSIDHLLASALSGQ